MPLLGSPPPHHHPHPQHQISKSLVSLVHFALTITIPLLLTWSGGVGGVGWGGNLMVVVGG